MKGLKKTCGSTDSCFDLKTRADSPTYLLLADSQANEADALDGLAAEQPELLLHSVLDDVFERGHEQVVVWHKLLLCSVSHGGDGRHHLLQDQFGALMD